MAKWGEGDPRWLVEHREDGKNVNGWHWEDRNKLAWTKKRLPELFEGVAAELSGGEGTLTIVAVKSVTGEASVMTRKGNKKFAHYELKLTLGWEAQLTESDSTVKGEVEIDEFSSTVEPDEYVFSVSAEKTGPTEDKCKQVVQGMQERIYAVLQQFVEELGQQ